MEAVCRVVCYLKGIAGEGIFLHTNSALQLYNCYDSDLGACPLSRTSLTGHFVTLEQSPISWRTKNKQWCPGPQLKLRTKPLSLQPVN